MKAIFAIILLAIAMLSTFCTSALAQGESAQYWYEKGLKLNANQSFEEAVQAYDQAIKLDPKNPEFWSGKASSLWLLHRDQESTESWKKALQLYNDTLQKNPRDIDSWIGKGRAFTMLAWSDRADLRETYRVAELNAYENALRISPQNSTLLCFKGSALYELRRYGEAIQAYDQALKIGFDPSHSWLADGTSHVKGLAQAALGKTNESENSYQEALKSFDEAIRKADTPENLSQAWLSKGFILQEQGKYNESIKALDNATDADPNNEMAWRVKGFMLANWMGRYQEGLAALDKALELKPTADVWEAEGRVFNELGRYKEAINASEKAMSLNQNLTRTWLIKGRALLGLGRYQEALDVYAKAENTYDEQLFAGMGFALACWNKSSEASEAFNKSLNASEIILQKDNKSAYAWFWKGDALRGLGRYQEALDAYNRSLENGKDYAISSWRGKGYALKALGYQVEADAAFAKVKKLEYEASAKSQTKTSSTPVKILAITAITASVKDRSVEITNSLTEAQSFKGWTLSINDGKNQSVALPDFTLGSGNKINIHFGNGKTNETDLFLNSSIALNDTAGNITLKNETGKTVASFGYRVEPDGSVTGMMVAKGESSYPQSGSNDVKMAVREAGNGPYVTERTEYEAEEPGHQG